MSPEPESTPLLPPPVTTPTRVKRTVTFNDNPVTKTIEPDEYARPSRHAGYGTTTSSSSSSSSHMAPLGGSGMGPPMLSALNSKLRRRNSNSSALPSSTTALKIGPQRTTKTAEKLKTLPIPDFGEEGPDQESGREVYSQYTRIKDPASRRDAARLGKADRARLPRVTAYCLANKYQLDPLMKWLKSRVRLRGTAPKRIDECLYSTFSYDFRKGDGGDSGSQTPVDESLPSTPIAPSPERRFSTGSIERQQFASLLAEDSSTDMSAPLNDTEVSPSFPFTESPFSLGTRDENTVSDGTNNGLSQHDHLPSLDTQAQDDGQQWSDPILNDINLHNTLSEVFIFDYGVVVIWGMTEAQEARFLKDISRWELEKLPANAIEAEYFNYYYTPEYQPRIYNDYISLRMSDRHNYMTKLAISHALAQSVKTSMFEELITSTVESSQSLPAQIALTGKVVLSKSQINMRIGNLFHLRVQVHLNGSVLDTPELFWDEPLLEPTYMAVRQYLEIDQRAQVLADRLDVISDLLAVLRQQLSEGHGETLEWIVIFLIAAEILVALVNILVDVYAGVD